MDAPPSEDRLDSWKEIAAYLKRDVTTVQRWEKREGMPVHRHVHDKLGSIYAFKSELDGWARGRHADVERSVEEPAPLPPPVVAWPRNRMVLGILGAAVLVFAAGAAWLLTRHDDFLRDPLTAARFQNVTDFGGTEQAATVSRDGRFVAFLSDRDGQTDVWLTQIGVGQFYNLTRGRIPGLINPAVRNLGFSPDGALVTFWTRADKGAIGVIAVPTLGGEPRPYLEDTAEYDWATDSRLVSHSSGPGDPTFVRRPGEQGRGQKIFEAAAGLHAHFQIWSPDGAFIYFIQGSPPDDMDIWRLRTSGGAAEQITHHRSRVSHPVFLNRRTLLYLATDSDGSGPWLHTLDVEHPSLQRVDTGVNRYTSLAASADGGRLVASLSSPRSSLWRLRVVDGPLDASAAAQISLTTGSGFAPRLGANYLLYLSTSGAASGIWKLANGAVTELWSTTDGRIVGGPEIAPHSDRVAFSVAQHGRTLLYVMDADGTNARVVTQSLDLRGDPAWSPDGQSITASANVNGAARLFRISLAGASSPLVDDYGVEPSWSPDGDFLVYSGADVGTKFPVKAITAASKPYAIPALTLTRGARRLRFLHGGRALVVLRGDLRHKDLWLIDLATGAERQLTRLPSDFDVRDFDVSPDGGEIVLERVQEHSDIVLIDLARQH
jgi:Tol biopolymer transport system component